MSFVYSITNRINGKVYVGKANNPAQRWRAHKSRARLGGLCVIHRAIRKYGAENFDFQVVSGHTTEEDAYRAEADTIRSMRTTLAEGGYNANAGGIGNMTPSDGVRQKVRDALLGHIVTEATREKLRQARTGTQHTTETKLKMSLTSKGKPKTTLAREHMSEALRGRPVSDATRAKLRASCKRNAHPPVVTDELRARLTAAVNERWRKWRAAKVAA